MGIYIMGIVYRKNDFFLVAVDGMLPIKYSSIYPRTYCIWDIIDRVEVFLGVLYFVLCLLRTGSGFYLIEYQKIYITFTIILISAFMIIGICFHRNIPLPASMQQGAGCIHQQKQLTG